LFGVEGEKKLSSTGKEGRKPSPKPGECPRERNAGGGGHIEKNWLGRGEKREAGSCRRIV